VWQNPAHLSNTISSSLHHIFLTEIAGCGLASTESEDAPSLSISIQGTPATLLLVAGFGTPPEAEKIRMVEIARSALTDVSLVAQIAHLRAELLWQQEAPVQGALEWIEPASGGNFLFLLAPGALVRLRLTDNAWNLVDSTELPVPRRLIRIPDGTLSFLYPDTQPQIFFQGKSCEIKSAEHVSFNCRESILGGKTMPDILSHCDDKAHRLLTDKGDFSVRDRVGVAEPDLPVEEMFSHGLVMPGPILDTSGRNDRRAATAVVRNLSTGNYEVYRITLACGN
jgi:hypothetical protein